jgi:6-phosphogluconolactonase (cycloisomerase 2 family)
MYLRFAVFMLVTAALGACGGGGGSSGSASYPVAGTVYGATSAGLELKNGTDTLSLGANATAFQFANRLQSGSAYDVTVATQPPGLTCGVHNGSGTVGPNAPATNISVYCVSGQEFVYAGGDLFSIDTSTGALTLTATTTDCCVLAIADPLGHFLFAVDTFSLGIDTYAIDPATGALTPKTQTASPAPGGFTSLVIDPSGMFLYATVSQQPTVYGYAIGSGATLTPIPGSPFAAGSYPVALAFDTEPVFLYAANMQDGTISAYTIGQSGALMPITGSPFHVVAAGAGLDALAAAPAGGFVYAHAGVGSGSGIYAFTVDDQTGSLSALPGNPYDAPQSGLSTLALSPTGTLIFLANQNANTVSVASLNSTTGVPTVVAGSPFAGGGVSGQVTPDPSGNFLYVADSLAVSGFAINGTTGALTMLPTSPFAAGAGTYVLAVRPKP